MSNVSFPGGTQQHFAHDKLQRQPLHCRKTQTSSACIISAFCTHMHRGTDLGAGPRVRYVPGTGPTLDCALAFASLLTLRQGLSQMLRLSLKSPCGPHTLPQPPKNSAFQTCATTLTSSVLLCPHSGTEVKTCTDGPPYTLVRTVVLLAELMLFRAQLRGYRVDRWEKQRQSRTLTHS